MLTVSLTGGAEQSAPAATPGKRPSREKYHHRIGGVCFGKEKVQIREKTSPEDLNSAVKEDRLRAERCSHIHVTHRAAQSPAPKGIFLIKKLLFGPEE